MSPTPGQEGPPDPMTVTEFAAHVQRSRQLIHRLAATDQAFPKAVMAPGSTVPRYPLASLEAYWEQRLAGLKQGRRTDLEERKEETADETGHAPGSPED
jgi:hypothetical protein